MTQALFSIVVPTRNRVEAAKRAIASALNQSHRGFELIVSDNSTAENTGLEEWLRSRPDLPPRFEYIRTGGTLPMDANWEAASLRARGRYLLVLPDRWVMRGGALGLLASIIAQQDPECVFWDSRLAVQHDGRYRTIEDAADHVQCDIRDSRDLLKNLLDFNGYKNNTVYTQPFPRGLNCIVRQDIIATVRAKTGVFFAPNACDYTSGVSLLLNTHRMTHLRDSLFLAMNSGTDSNGQQLSVYGVSTQLKPATLWRGLQLDTVLLTVLNDIESTLERCNAPGWSKQINIGNVLLSLLSEIHFKEWHGSPLDTAHMRSTLLAYARNLEDDKVAPGIVEKLHAYDQQFMPDFREMRKLLQRLRLFYKLYGLKHAVRRKVDQGSWHLYTDDLLSTRSILVADVTGAA